MTFPTCRADSIIPCSCRVSPHGGHQGAQSPVDSQWAWVSLLTEQNRLVVGHFRGIVGALSLLPFHAPFFGTFYEQIANITYSTKESTVFFFGVALIQEGGGVREGSSKTISTASPIAVRMKGQKSIGRWRCRAWAD